MEWKSLLMVLLVLENVTQQFAEKRSCSSKNVRNKITLPQRQQQRSNTKRTAAAAAIKRNVEAAASYRYRYRPQSSKCLFDKCDRYHKHLLLVTDSMYRDLLKECSLTIYLRDLVDLSRHLCETTKTTDAAAAPLALNTDTAAALIIVHSDYYVTRNATYLDIIKIMIACLGNVSVYVDDYVKYLDVVNGCDKSDYCANLFSLSPVIEQSKRWKSASTSPFFSSSSSDSLSSTYLDMYDQRWLPIIGDNSRKLSPLTPPAVVSFVDSQIRLLASPICARSRRFNVYYEIAPAVMSEATATSTEHRVYENVNESDLDKLDDDNETYDKNDDDIDTGINAEVDDTEYPKEYRLELEDILPVNPSNYDKNRAPRTRNQPTLVDFHVTVLSIDSIDEESMTYVADIFLAQSWRDQRLRLPDSTSMGEYRILNVDWLHDIWKPDSFFKNAKQVTFHEISVPNHYLWLYHDKTLLYMSKLNLVLSCAMKFESYPHDTQVCSMMIESLSHTTHDLVFRWNATDPLVVNPAIELPQLDISSNYTDDCTIEYSTGNFTCLSVVFNLRRRLGYHLFHTYIPSALIVVMSWISFWINPEAIPARVTLGVTSLLTLATQNTQSQQSLPPVSYVKAVDIWMSSCSVFVFLSLMEFAIVNNYMGPIATKIMRGYSLEDMHITDDIKGLQSGNEGNPTRNAPSNVPQYVTFRNGKAIALCIDKFSRIFFPFSFIVLNIAYWTAFLK